MKGHGLVIGYRTQMPAFRVDREDFRVQTSCQRSMNEEMILGVHVKFTRYCHKSVSVPRIADPEYLNPLLISRNIDIPMEKRLTDSVHALEMDQPE
jgi:hypothetical protein